MKQLGVFLLHPGWDASPSQGYTPSIKFVGTHLYTCVERSTVRVKCLAQEHNATSPTRGRSQTARSGVEDTNHEASTPPCVRISRCNFKVLQTAFVNYHFFFKSLLSLGETRRNKRQGSFTIIYLIIQHSEFNLQNI